MARHSPTQHCEPHHPIRSERRSAYAGFAHGARAPLPALLGVELSTRSFIACPTETGYASVYVHSNGHPDGRLPLLLTAYQHRFGGDVEAMARHLIDDVDFGWSNSVRTCSTAHPTICARA